MDRYKACHTIFEGIPKIDLGGVHLRGFVPDKIELESKYYFRNTFDPLVKKYLPGAYVESEAEALNKINEYVDRFLLKSCVPFTIATRQLMPIGYILCHSPLVNFQNTDEKIGDWTIDFWLTKDVRGQKIMKPLLFRLLGYLQEKELDRVFMYVDKDNDVSIHIIEQCHFIHLGESGDGKLYKYGIKLKREASLF